MRISIMIFITIVFQCLVFAQEGLYNADEFFISNDEILFVEGDFTNEHEDFENNGDFTLWGNLENSKLILNEGSGLLRLEGDGQQLVKLTDRFKTNDLEINNVNNVVFEDFAHLSVFGDLDFTLGKFFTKAESQIIFKPGALYFYASDDSHINGPTTKEGNSQFTFPIGKKGKLRPLRIDGLNTLNGFEAEYFAETFEDLETNFSIDHVSDWEYWNFEKIFGADIPKLTLVWNEDSFINLNKQALQIGYYNDNTWVGVESSTELPEQLEPDLTSINGIEDYGNFTFASTNPLNKIDDGILRFDLIKEDCFVNLSWQAIERSSRINAYHIYKKDKSNIFRIIKTISAENTDNISHYNYIDDSVEENEIVHYKIITVYENGTTIPTIQKFIKSTCKDLSFLLYPTVLQPNDVLSLQIDAESGKEFPISIVDELGRILYTEDLVVEPGRNIFTFDIVRFGQAEYFIWSPEELDVPTLRFQVIR